MEEARKVKSRRPHLKMRTGCVQCKKRKIKCDETKPSCRKCTQHEITCLYLQKHLAKATNTNSCPTSSPSPHLSASTLGSGQPATFTVLDLELIHFWTSTTGPTTVNEGPSDSSSFHTTFIELALQHPFLMLQVLSLSALHLAQLKPQATPYNIASTAHHDRGLSLFQPALSFLTRENSEACFAFSILLSIHTWAATSQAASSSSNRLNSLKPLERPENSESIHIQCMKVFRGNTAVHSAVYPWLEEGKFSLFKPWENLLKTSSPMPLPSIEQQHLDSFAETWLCSCHPKSVKEILDESLRELRLVYSLAHAIQNSNRHVVVLAWMSRVPGEFVKLVETRVPEATLILASYSVLLKRLEYLWWCRGIAESLLRMVRDEIGTDGNQTLNECLRWPIEEVLGNHEQTAE